VVFAFKTDKLLPKFVCQSNTKLTLIIANPRMADKEPLLLKAREPPSLAIKGMNGY